MPSSARADGPLLGDALRNSLRDALHAGPECWRGAALETLVDTGLAHAHIRLLGHGALARIPKQSQMNLAPRESLLYEAACFTQAAASGHTPRALAVLPVSPGLPHGALIVEAIIGRPSALPHDLHAIAQALAALHRLPLLEPEARRPLQDAADPLHELLLEIETQATIASQADLSRCAFGAISEELERLGELCARPARPSRRLISFDAHPGNFLIDSYGRAVLVDLEKCRYSHPSLDLAHATLYTSTTWSAQSTAVLSPAEVIDFYRAWAAAFGAGAELERTWHLPLRRAMWLWSLTWCAKWRVLSRCARAPGDAAGEDWSADLSDRGLVAHVKGRVDHYLGEHAIAFVREEFVELARAFGELAA